MEDRELDYLREYSKALIDFEKSVNALQVLVKEIDHVEGTRFFEILRTNTGIHSVSNDIPRIIDKVLILREICERLKTSEGPTGIVLDRGKKLKA